MLGLCSQVSSEGEKSITTKEGGGEEEGREAEASPSTNTRSKSGMTRGHGGSGRRALRQGHMRGGEGRSGPTPIIWEDQRDRGKTNKSCNVSELIQFNVSLDDFE